MDVSHIVIRIPAEALKRYDDDDDDDKKDKDDDDDNQIIQIDGYSRLTRYKRISNFKPWTSELGSLRHYITLDSITDVISVEFKNSNCTDNTHSHYSMIELIEPWVPKSGQVNFFAEK